jgi:hypothetical protein
LYLGKIKNKEKIIIVKNKFNNKYPDLKFKSLNEIKIPNEEKMLNKKIGTINSGW